MELLSLIKRKSRKRSSDSSSDSPDFKRRQEEKELEEEEITEINAENRDVVLTALSMAEDFASKADEILAKLSKLDAITSQIHFLQQSLDKMNITVSAFQTEVAQIKADFKNSTSEINTFKDSVASLKKDVEEEQAKVKCLEEKTEDELNKLPLQILDYEA